MPTIPDERFVSVLRPFVAATGPVLSGLRDADPFRLGRLAQRRAREVEDDRRPEDLPVPTDAGRADRARALVRRGRAATLDRLSTSRLPGTPRWTAMSAAERDRWWVDRVGRFTSVVASVPGIGGALARRLPVADIIGLAAQGLVVCAIAGEHGLTDRDQQVRLLAAVLFGRDVDPAQHGDAHTAEVDRAAGELTGELPSGRGGDAGRATGGSGAGERHRLQSLAGSVWRMGRTLTGLHEELGRRPQGGRFWRAVANLPVAGVLGAYKSERSGLKRAARDAAAWVDDEQAGREHGRPRRR